MVALWTWVLIGILLYTVIAMVLRARGQLPDYIELSGPITTIHTKRGRIFLDRLAARERFWRAWGNLGVGITLVVMVLSGLVVIIALNAVIAEPSSQAIENPQNVLVIPGVNDFLPLNAAGEILFGLVVGLVVHEGGHGLLCRVENIEIESMGIAMLAFIPLGAFVQPNAENQEAASRGSQVRMFAAGITNNFAVTALALLILVGPILGSITVAPGASVGSTYPGSDAAEQGFERGEVITDIEGMPVANASDLDRVLWQSQEDRVEVSLRGGDTRTVDRRLLILGTVEGVADDVTRRDPLARIEAVNGTPVDTERALLQLVENRTIARLETDNGNVTVPIGAFASRVVEGGPLADAGAPTDGTPVIITRVDGERVSNASALRELLGEREPGQSADIETYVDGDRETFSVELGGTDRAILGYQSRDGYSGILVDDFGVDPYPAGDFLDIVSGDAIPDGVSFPANILFYVLQLLILPFMALMDPSVSFSFAGFTPDITSFYMVEGPLGFMGGSLFVIANLLFWTGWINFNLAIFNCIPSFPLDGGHIFRVATETVVSRFPIDDGRFIVTLVTTGMTLLMGLALLALVFGPVIF